MGLHQRQLESRDNTLLVTKTRKARSSFRPKTRKVEKMKNDGKQGAGKTAANEAAAIDNSSGRTTSWRFEFETSPRSIHRCT